MKNTYYKVNISSESTHGEAVKGIVVGNYPLDQNLTNSESSYTANLLSAKEVISQLNLNDSSLPDFIYFNLPLNKSQLISFLHFIQDIPVLKFIPLLWNGDFLSFSEMEFIKHLNFIDDVVSGDSGTSEFKQKVIFLKKYKNYPPIPNRVSNLNLSPNANHVKTSMFFKRLIDITVSVSVLILFLPVLILAAIAIKLESRGPIFYNSVRAGRGYKLFSLYKFRSMEVDADTKIHTLDYLNQYENGDGGIKFMKIKNDPRVTKVGRFLRKTSIDEIPQMINVLLGDMSLVGNRPLPLYEAQTLVTNQHVERFMAPAGITGLWQVTKKSNPDMTSEERIGLDIQYAREFNIINDFKIMLKTPAAMFQLSDN